MRPQDGADESDWFFDILAGIQQANRVLDGGLRVASDQTACRFAGDSIGFIGGKGINGTLQADGQGFFGGVIE
jgi:hypothetical protein